MTQGKEFLYVGHYVDINNNFVLKIGTTNDKSTQKIIKKHPIQQCLQMKNFYIIGVH